MKSWLKGAASGTSFNKVPWLSISTTRCDESLLDSNVTASICSVRLDQTNASCLLLASVVVELNFLGKCDAKRAFYVEIESGVDTESTKDSSSLTEVHEKRALSMELLFNKCPPASNKTPLTCS